MRAATAASLKRGGVRERLVEAAGQVFAEHGFRDGTVHEICRRAGANIAAVNYYFGDKRNLYVEVFRHARRARAHDAEAPLDPNGVPPEEQLRHFVRSFLARSLGNDRPAWHGVIIQREIAEPTGLLGGVFEKEIRPRHERLAAIVRALSPEPMPRDQVLLCVFGILGQCVFYRRGRPVLTSLYPELHLDTRSIDLLADHITRFTVAALRNLAAKDRSERQ